MKKKKIINYSFLNYTVSLKKINGLIYSVQSAVVI